MRIFSHSSSQARQYGLYTDALKDLTHAINHLKIGVLSDTHDQCELIQKAVKHFNDANVSWVFHCGDWVSPFILHFFQDLQAPLRGVFGNNDRDKFRHLAFKKR